MLTPVIHTTQTAPAQSREALETVRKKYGFVPNLNGAMASSPAVLVAYVALSNGFDQSSFSPIEQQVVTLTVSFHNSCVYCMSGHSMLARMAGLDEAGVEALRRGEPLAEPRLEALRIFTKRLLETRGQATEGDVDAFLAAGYTAQQVAEVPLGIAFKTLSNYFHHLHPVPVDEPVAKHRWEPPVRPAPRRVLVSGWIREGAEKVLAEYQAGAGPIMAKHGGRPTLKAKPASAIAGKAPDLVVLLEFPSAEAVAATFADPDYLPLVPLRDQAFTRLEVTDLGDAL